MIEFVEDSGELLAIIIRSSFDEPGVHFFTPDEFSQQLAFMRRPEEEEIDAHVHNSIPREVEYTQEVLFIRRGKLRVDFYSEDREYLHSRVLTDRDVILLASGGHGFEVLEEVEMIEVKQGPYAGENDKTRFDSASPDEIEICETIRSSQ
ncbi:hypothetical protein [Salinibacter ruber]|uniref:hypothetical protein n=1 Tax=Salinibacter ruber TaxID=146919 RepID=UPI002166C60F|nr:hypothetical protein [Salinibacter ruber]MCS4054128.1 mannose-6-phosphate isomerase-like protein (cupin superfamily) [Salinibacter ruber]